ncbi:hypothetical protein DICPUDRAFT_78969 [Dictyostelium purpureum]|uniref:Crossover junction endonuclease MUS81 n=1 Tax=Dictyostelium purpureum TaxID=5786 RepID=F0ZL61_DICPU|nr:uncharacterized protein DICPUDRAFT_78969 [Dictyostelium purpureum]EGC35338.1 hypothetical protein DICPUDRAFT_78969 [Dictyostelium purpureum]|eukprot:XP_003288145.1 hypothetical protein DICPUDRAFT_78969 [Dictyostelium purpureum]
MSSKPINNSNNNNNNNNNSIQSANPHIIEFLQQQIDFIKSRPGADLKKTSIYKKAIHSLTLYPLPIFNGKECEALSGFGPTLSKKVDQFLKTKSHPLYPKGPPTPLKIIYSRTSNIEIDNNDENKSPKKRQRKTKTKDDKENIDKPKPSRSRAKSTKTTSTSKPNNFIEIVDDDILQLTNDINPTINESFNESFNFDFGSFDLNNVNNNNFIDSSNSTSNNSNNNNKPNNTPLKFNKHQITPIKSPYNSNKFNDSIIFSPISPVKFTTPLKNKKRKHELTSPSTAKSPSKYNHMMSLAFSPKRILRSTPVKSKPDKESVSIQSTPIQSKNSYIFSEDENDINTINIINNNINNNKKQLIKPIRLSFTEEDLLKVNIGSDIDNKSTSNSTTITTTTTTTTTTTNNSSKKIINFKEIKCFIDNREVKSVTERDYIVNKLKNNGINAEIKKLELGDFIWVAIDEKGEEWLLDYIMERKRIDDLSSSIMDGRYKEQKFRLKKTGCNNIIYLVEGVLSNNIMASQQYKKWGSVNFGLSPDALASALVSTQINDDITIKQTISLEETIEYITFTTEYFKDKLCKPSFLSTSNPSHLETLKKFIYKGEIIQCSVDTFNQSNVKSKGLMLLEFFAIQLMQIPGISPEKARTIVDHYPTPYSLYIALKRFKGDDKTASNFFKDFEFGKNNRKFGSDISERLFKIYNNKTYS